MLAPLRNRFGIPGVISVIALVFAMFGGAYAATASKRHHKKGGAVVAVAKRYSKAFSKRYSKVFSQRFAKPGETGPAGPQGPKGDTGAKGDTGTIGPEGPEGPKGEKGDTGEAGACSVQEPECALPPGATETGTWLFGPYPDLEKYPGKNTGVKTPLSFPIPLEVGPTPHLVLNNGKEMNEEFEEIENPPACPGSVTAPSAEPGQLCIYAKSDLFSPATPTASILINPGSAFTSPQTGSSGASPVGVLLEASTKETNGAQAFGVWAVTGE